MENFSEGFYDDIVICSKKFNWTYKACQTSFGCYFLIWFKIEPWKCLFLVDIVDYLGFTIKPSQITISNKKVESFNNSPVPKSIKDIKKFLGLAGWYRKLLPNFFQNVSTSKCNVMKKCYILLNWWM